MLTVAAVLTGAQASYVYVSTYACVASEDRPTSRSNGFEKLS